MQSSTSPRSPNFDKKDTAIMNCLLGITEKHGKLYCFPSQKTIQARCREYGHEKMAISTLNRHLQKLEALAFIERRHRHILGPDGKWKYRSTLYILLARAWEWVKKCGRFFGKALAFLGLPQMRNNPYNQRESSRGGGLQNASPPPGFGEKGAASPSVSLRRPGPPERFDFKNLLTPFDR
jgi:predicted transcriptional regulator